MPLPSSITEGHRQLTAAVALVFGGVSCRTAPQCPEAAPGWVHQVALADCVSRQSGMLPSRELVQVTERLTSPAIASTIGVLDGPDEEVIGLVDDVTLDQRGHTIIADGQRRDVRVYDPSGQYVQTIGGAGEGPGEFRAPHVLAFDSDGVLYVEDRSLRIQRFRLGDGGYEYAGQIRLEMSVADLCIMRDTMYVQGRRLGSGIADSVIHKVSLDGELLESFGEVFTHSAEGVVENHHRGYLACLEALDAIAFMPYQLPAELRLYNASGSVRWITTFPNIRAILIEARPSGGVAQTIPEDGFHILETLSVLDSGHLLVQLAMYTREQQYSTRIPVRRESYVVSVETGRGGFLSDSLGAITIERGRIVQILHDPFPQIVVRH